MNIAVIGVGGWGKNHARVLTDLGVLAGICDANEVRAKEVAAKYNTCYYTSVDNLLTDNTKLNGCIVCTPTKTHFDVAKKVMEHGVNVFVEKPLSYSSIECEEMIDISLRRKVLLTSGYIERFNPVVQDVKRIIKNRTYGDLLMMEFHRENRMPMHIKDVGIIYDTSVHDIDTAMFLFNSRPNVVFARAGAKFHSYEDFATLMLGFEDHKVAIIASNWITPKKVRTFNAVCTEGIISGDFITQEICIDEAEQTITPRRAGNLLEPLSLELNSFIGAIQGKIEESLISATDATNVTKVAESAILSSKTGSPVYLELK
ncbi:MAG: Gfo/Idh/MocA family oxidoreductase [Thermoproteota archaeon]|nr:Gfo/Idh/MocA family oxidoreductase [Thermoproteota archaeon]